MYFITFHIFQLTIIIEKFVQFPTQYEHKGKVVDATLYKEEIKVKGRVVPHIETVVETIHGPVVSKSLFSINNPDYQYVTLRTIATTTESPFQGFIGLNRAKNWKDFRAAVSQIYAPPLNLVYADDQGNIGHSVSGVAPIRDNNSEGMIPAIVSCFIPI
jgi:penicillin amidase